MQTRATLLSRCCWFAALVVGCGSSPAGPAQGPADASGLTDSSALAADATGVGGSSGGAADANVGQQEAAVEGGKDATDVPAESGTAGGGGGPVALDGVFNARHVGGLITSDGKRVRTAALIRSGHLGGLSSTGCGQLSSLGVRAVLDLREESDAAATPDAACAKSGAAYVLVPLPKILPPSVDAYLKTIAAAEPQLPQVFGALAAPQGSAVLVHCVIGRDRASMITALVLLALGVPRAAIAQDFVANQDSSVQTDAAWLNAVFDRVESSGGTAAYFTSHGVTPQQIESLKGLLLE